MHLSELKFPLNSAAVRFKGFINWQSNMLKRFACSLKEALRLHGQWLIWVSGQFHLWLRITKRHNNENIRLVMYKIAGSSNTGDFCSIQTSCPIATRYETESISGNWIVGTFPFKNPVVIFNQLKFEDFSPTQFFFVFIDSTGSFLKSLSFGRLFLSASTDVKFLLNSPYPYPNLRRRPSEALTNDNQTERKSPGPFSNFIDPNSGKKGREAARACWLTEYCYFFLTSKTVPVTKLCHFLKYIWQQFGMTFHGVGVSGKNFTDICFNYKNF